MDKQGVLDILNTHNKKTGTYFRIKTVIGSGVRDLYARVDRCEKIDVDVLKDKVIFKVSECVVIEQNAGWFEKHHVKIYKKEDSIEQEIEVYNFDKIKIFSKVKKNVFEAALRRRI